MDGLIQVENVELLPDLQLSQYWFQLKNQVEGVDHAEVKATLEQALIENDAAPLYRRIAEDLGWKVDKSALTRMQFNNDQKLLSLDADIKDAIENLGESEIREAYLARANYLTSIGEQEKAIEALDATYEKTIGSGQRLDIVFTKTRVGFFFFDHDLITECIEKATQLVEDGGDWDRRNRLKTYEGLHAMMTRDFDKAAALFLETIATFTSYELFPYKTFVRYAVIVCMVALERVDLKEKVVDASEFLSVIHDLDNIQFYLNSLYECDYAAFLTSLAGVVDEMKRNAYLADHHQHYAREMRIKAYSQLLASYRSVRLESMADSFGVSVEFMDKELCRFIAAGRLNCEIDKVEGVVETTRPDARNAQYEALIKQGDHLLNRMQKLSRVVNM